MHELKLLLFAQGLRFLLFDYKMLGPVRRRMMETSVFATLLKCPFCQGFWCGFLAFLFSFGLVDAFMWGLGSGIISLTWFAIVIPAIDKVENSD